MGHHYDQLCEAERTEIGRLLGAGISFLTIFLSSAEKSFEEYARLAGTNRDLGEVARCLDISANLNRSTTIIDLFPANIRQDQEQRWAWHQIGKIIAGCRGNHGVALRPYIEFLMRDIENAKRMAVAYQGEFTTALKPEGFSQAILHAAKNFGLVYAGGCLAVDAQILPYDKRELLRLMIRYFMRAARQADPKIDALSRAKSTLRARLSAESVCRLGRHDDFKSDDFEGYICNENERRRFIIRAASFQSWFANIPSGKITALEWLSKRRMLIFKQGRQSASGASLETRTLRWPDGRVVRSYEFYDPFGK